MRIGSGYDVHKFCKGDSIMLCGVEIPHTRGVVAHSDGDTAIHALVDAMLGAIGEGDIGTYFPPSDDKWKDVDSAVFLEFANKKLLENYTISNIDLIIICEKPKILSYKDEMVQRLAEILKIDSSRINIKATTTEGLGFTGREEGIEVQVAVLVE